MGLKSGGIILGGGLVGFLILFVEGDAAAVAGGALFVEGGAAASAVGILFVGSDAAAGNIRLVPGGTNASLSSRSFSFPGFANLLHSSTRLFLCHLA